MQRSIETSPPSRYRAALVAIREDTREAREALIGDDFGRCDEILERIEQTAISGLGHVALDHPGLVIPDA